MKLTIDSNQTAENVTLTVSGDVDMETSPQLRDEIKKTLKKKPPALRLKLTDVPYIDSSGVAVLIEGMKWSKKKSVDYALVAISNGVRDVLELSKLLPVFKVED